MARWKERILLHTTEWSRALASALPDAVAVTGLHGIIIAIMYFFCNWCFVHIGIGRITHPLSLCLGSMGFTLANNCIRGFVRSKWLGSTLPRRNILALYDKAHDFRVRRQTAAINIITTLQAVSPLPSEVLYIIVVHLPEFYLVDLPLAQK